MAPTELKDSDENTPPPDEERLSPKIIVSQSELSAFKIILAERPPALPSRQELRQARRCMLSGMVPGAIRKYLMQKKKHESITIDEEDDSESPAASVTPPSTSRNYGNNAGAMNSGNGRNNNSHINDDDDDDDIHIVGEYRRSSESSSSNDNHVLIDFYKNSNSVSTSSVEKNNPIVTGRPGPVVEIISNTTEEDSPLNASVQDADVLTAGPKRNNTKIKTMSSSSNNKSGGAQKPTKRMFSEAFSPDSTTPELKNPHNSNRKRCRNSDITPTTLSLQQERTPTPKLKIISTSGTPLAPPPLNKSRKQSHDSISRTDSDSSLGQGGSGGGGRNRKSSSSWVRQVLQEPCLNSCKISPDNETLNKQIARNEWKNIVEKWQRDLNSLDPPFIPKAENLGRLIHKAILGIGTRVSKDIPALAVDYFRALVSKYPVSLNDDATNYYITAFTESPNVNSNKPKPDDGDGGQYSLIDFLLNTLKIIQADAEAKVPSNAYPFFKILTKMVVNQYKEYKRSHVKLRPPFVVRFIEEKEKVVSYNFNCKRLLESGFKFLDYPDELKTVMRWIGLVAYHLGGHNHLDTQLQYLVKDFVDQVSRGEYANSTIQIIQSISDKHLGAAVCLKLLQRSIQFESITPENNSTPTDTEVKDFLSEISKSERIAGLKSQLREQNRNDELSAPQVSPLIGGNHKLMKKEGVNMKGEGYLHKLCRKESQNSKSALALEKTLKERNFPVNPTDNFGNTPLHDVIAHGRFDALVKFCEFCSDLTLPEYLRVNLLAQNDAGETPFHLAAVAKDQGPEMISMLLMMGENLQVTDEALKVLNSQGKMPYELAFTSESRTKLKPSSIVELPLSVRNVRVSSGSRAELESPDIRRLIALWSEFCSSNTIYDNSNDGN